MRAYRRKSRQDLGVSPDEFDQLRAFVEEIQPVIETARQQSGIEAPPPIVTQPGQGEPVFNPGGWVGRYPPTVAVEPEKLTTAEYHRMLRDVSGWIEIWDLPTAAAGLPLLGDDVDDERSVLLGYSHTLVAFTEEILSQRPAVNVQRITESGTQPRGSVDFQRTVQARAHGTGTEAVYERLQFSIDHPLNQLLIRFHAELEAKLDTMAELSQLLTPEIREHQRYHTQFLKSRFSEEIVDRSIQQPLTELVSKSRKRRDTPGHMVELIDLAESYIQRQALGIDFQHRLTIGIKPISKLYELWVLTKLLAELRIDTDQQPHLVGEGLHEIDLGSEIRLYYNTPVTAHSRFLASGLNSHPGRPDFALEIDGEIRWIGDAKYSPERNIGLDSYQRLLSYTVDLMTADTGSTASVIHVDRSADPVELETDDYQLTQFALRPAGERTAILPATVRRCITRCVTETTGN